MTLSVNDIKKLGQLSRLKLTDEEASKYRTELGGILRYVDKLQQAKIGKLPVTAPSTVSHLRLDDAKPWKQDEREIALRQAPELKNKSLKVKRILG